MRLESKNVTLFEVNLPLQPNNTQHKTNNANQQMDWRCRGARPEHDTTATTQSIDTVGFAFVVGAFCTCHEY